MFKLILDKRIYNKDVTFLLWKKKTNKKTWTW